MKQYSRYSSKVKRVNIPIPSFEYVHKSWISKQLGNSSPGFLIGRDHIIEKLKAWLTKEKTDGGSYLITGYRGMGKTSFVDRVLYELVGETNIWVNLLGLVCFIGYIYSIWQWNIQNHEWLIGVCVTLLGMFVICKFYWIKEKSQKYRFRLKTTWLRIKRDRDKRSLWTWWTIAKEEWENLSPKEWDRVRNMIHGANVKEKRYSHICVNVNLGQEILDERSILCVLTSQLYRKYLAYTISPVANVEMWLTCATAVIVIVLCMRDYHLGNVNNIIVLLKKYWLITLVTLTIIVTIIFHILRTLLMLKILSKRIDARLEKESGLNATYKNVGINSGITYNYPIANTRNIESSLIAILDIIEHFPIHPKFYFVFDELDKIETPQKKENSTEYSGEKYHPGGGTSRKRLTTVLHLLANMKFFTSTAKAKFIFIAGREMYDGYLADMTDRESAISSLFNGVIYVDSFCKNEKSEKDVMYNVETFVSSQLLPKAYIIKKVTENYIECKLSDKQYVNIDINLKMYFEYLTMIYTKTYLKDGDIQIKEKRRKAFDDAREGIDKAIGLLYHYIVYLYHVSNGSPKKMRLAFESYIRPIKDRREFQLSNDSWMDNPLNGEDLDIHVSEKCRQLLSFGEKEQRVIGFIHFISYPVNQIMTDANQFGDKLLVSASFLINHIYKYHTGGFSWRNIEQTPELLEVYKIPEFRGFISSILNYLTQTHIIKISCGLYQYKFRKQIAEEISLASKVSEEVSAIFNFMRDESQMVKIHYIMQRNNYMDILKEEGVQSIFSVAGQHHIMGDLYMADEDYNNAIREYQTAISVLSKGKKIKGANVEASLMFAYLRNYMKLGIAYEKRRTYVPAFNSYNEVIGLLMQYGRINRDIDKMQWNMVHDAEKIHKLELLENTQMTYPAILAKLFVNEKIDLGGITKINIETAITEFESIHKLSTGEEKFILEADFYRRLGDILYYKNGLVGFYQSGKNMQVIKEKIIDCEECINRMRNEWKKNRTTPCYACHYYHKSMGVIASYLFDEPALKNMSGNDNEKISYIKSTVCSPLHLLEFIVKVGSAKSMRQNHMVQMAEILDCLGNVMLSCAGSTEKRELEEIDSEFLSRFLHDVHEMNRNIDKVDNKDDYRLLDELYRKDRKLNRLEKAILYFWEASLTFKYGRDPKKASDSMKKILRVLQNYLRIADQKATYGIEENKIDWGQLSAKRKIIIGEFLNEIKNRLIKQCLICLYEHYNFINIVEIQRLKWIFYTQMYEYISLSRLTLFPDVEEIMLIYYEMIKLCVVAKEYLYSSIGEDITGNIITDQEIARNYIGKYSRSRNCINDSHDIRIEYSWNIVSERNKDFTIRLAGIYNNIMMGALRHDSTSYEKILALRFKAIMNKFIMYKAFPDMEGKKDTQNKMSLQANHFVNCFNKYLKSGDRYESNGVEWKLFFPKIFDLEEMKCETLEDRLQLLEFLVQDSIYCLTNILEQITPYTSTTLFTNSFMGSVYRDLNEWNVLFDALFNYYKVFDQKDKWQETDEPESMELESIWEYYDKESCHMDCPIDECKYKDRFVRERKNQPDFSESEENMQMMWQSVCPYYSLDRCKQKQSYFETTRQNVTGDIDRLGDEYRRIFKCRNISDRLFGNMLNTIKKPNVQFLMTNYSEEMALKAFRKAREIHREGKAYKDMISRMYYLDDDLKNDTIQFDLAVERFKINCGNIDDNIEMILKYITNNVHELEYYCMDNQTRSTLHRRFHDLFWNVTEERE